jgi:hypothetical protein
MIAYGVESNPHLRSEASSEGRFVLRGCGPKESLDVCLLKFIEISIQIGFLSEVEVNTWASKSSLFRNLSLDTMKFNGRPRDAYLKAGLQDVRRKKRRKNSRQPAGRLSPCTK